MFVQHEENLTEEEKQARRKQQADAADKRAKNFNQGGGGEKIKAKAKQLEAAEKANAEKGGGPNMKWNVSS